MKLRKLFCILSSILIFSISSCTKASTEPTKEEDKEPETEFIENQYLVEDGLSSYYIVTSKNP